MLRWLNKRVHNNVGDTYLDNVTEHGDDQNLFCQIVPTLSVQDWAEMEHNVHANGFGLVFQMLHAGFDINAEVFYVMKCSKNRILSQSLGLLAFFLASIISQRGDHHPNGCASYGMMKFLVDRGARLSIRGGNRIHVASPFCDSYCGRTLRIFCGASNIRLANSTTS